MTYPSGVLGVKPGNLAAEREKQVVEWAFMRPLKSFTGDDVVQDLFGERISKRQFYTDKLLESYRVACEDLARKQILKRTYGDNTILYIWAGGD